MAIAFDTATNSGTAITGTLLSWNHVVTTPGILMVGVEDQSAGAFSSATYSGIPLSLATTKIFSLRTSRAITAFYMVNPPAGNHTISINYPSSTLCAGVSASYS